VTDRSVGDIVEAVQEQGPVTEAELRLALLCLYYDLQMACPSDYAGKPQVQLEWRAKENFERRFRMLKAPPAIYLGPRWTPGTPENAQGRAGSKAILAAFEKSRKP
jgi:hypothetical protein